MSNVAPLIPPASAPVKAPYVTDLVLDGLTAAKDVAIKLKRNGFTVIGVTIGHGQPTVQVFWHRIITELLEAGQASYVYRTDRERHGEFYGEANDGSRVRIVWVERIGQEH